MKMHNKKVVNYRKQVHADQLRGIRCGILEARRCLSPASRPSFYKFHDRLFAINQILASNVLSKLIPLGYTVGF